MKISKLLFIFLSISVTHSALAGVENFTGVKWSSCTPKRHCIVLETPNMGTSSLYGEDYMFALKVKVEIINLNDKKKAYYNGQTALWDNKRQVWTVFRATKVGSKSHPQDYYFTQKNLQFELYHHG